jgi:hypothetical protein
MYLQRKRAVFQGVMAAARAIVKREPISPVLDHVYRILRKDRLLPDSIDFS